MYTDFYNLAEKPFDLTPSPRFLYLGESHKEALALLTYGVMERKGFVLLTGEVGTGKTTMIRALLRDLDVGVKCIHLANPLLTPRDFINYLTLSAFGSRVHFKSKAEFLLQLEALLKERVRRQKYFVLIVDEAHKLAYDVLEEIRLLSNLETDEEKLISIFLVGQPELNERLSTPECRPLLQRISIRHHIQPLKLEETEGYVATRLKVAGANKPDELFPKKVIKAVHECSGGYPRMINILGDNVLLLGFSRGERKITPAMVRECYEELNLKGSFPRREQGGPKSPVKEKARPRSWSAWKWAAVLLILLMIGSLVAVPQVRQVLLAAGRQLSEASEDLFRALKGSNSPKSRSRSNPAATNSLASNLRATTQTYVPDSVPKAGEVPVVPGIGEAQASHPETTSEKPPVPSESAGMEKQNLPVLSARDSEEVRSEETMKPPGEKQGGHRSVVVKRGDTLLELIAEIYGTVDDGLVKMVQEFNPEVRDINVIAVGQKIVFPPLEEALPARAYTIHVGSFSNLPNAQILIEKLNKQGRKAFVFPVSEPGGGKAYRVTVGTFASRRDADILLGTMVSEGTISRGEVIRLEMR